MRGRHSVGWSGNWTQSTCQLSTVPVQQSTFPVQRHCTGTVESSFRFNGPSLRFQCSVTALDKLAVLVERPVFPALEDLSQVGESLLNQPEEEGSKRVKKADMR